MFIFKENVLWSDHQMLKQLNKGYLCYLTFKVRGQISGRGLYVWILLVDEDETFYNIFV